MTNTEMNITRRGIIACNPEAPLWGWLEENPALNGAEIWARCPRGDWLLWLAGHLLPLTQQQWARLALMFMRNMVLIDGERVVANLLEDASSQARITAVERWLRGEPVPLDDERRAMAKSEHADAAFLSHRQYFIRQFAAYLAAKAAAQHVYTLCCLKYAPTQRLVFYARQTANRAAAAFILNAVDGGVGMERASVTANLMQADIVRNFVQQLAVVS